MDRPDGLDNWAVFSDKDMAYDGGHLDSGEVSEYGYRAACNSARYALHLETQNELLRTESNGYQSAAEGHCKRVVELERRRDELLVIDAARVAKISALEGRIAEALGLCGDPYHHDDIASILRGEE